MTVAEKWSGCDDWFSSAVYGVQVNAWKSDAEIRNPHIGKNHCDLMR